MGFEIERRRTKDGAALDDCRGDDPNPLRFASERRWCWRACRGSAVGAEVARRLRARWTSSSDGRSAPTTPIRHRALVETVTSS